MLLARVLLRDPLGEGPPRGGEERSRRAVHCFPAEHRHEDGAHG